MKTEPSTSSTTPPVLPKRGEPEINPPPFVRGNLAWGVHWPWHNNGRFPVVLEMKCSVKSCFIVFRKGKLILSRFISYLFAISHTLETQVITVVATAVENFHWMPMAMTTAMKRHVLIELYWGNQWTIQVHDFTYTTITDEKYNEFTTLTDKK